MELHLVPDIEVHWMVDPVREAHFFFLSPCTGAQCFPFVSCTRLQCGHGLFAPSLGVLHPTPSHQV